MSTAYYQYQPTNSLPVAIPGKQPQQTLLSRHNRNLSAYSQLSASPPERPESVSTSGAGLYSSASSQYASSEYDSSTGGGLTSVDLLDYMNDRLSQAYNPLPLEQTMASQAQMYVHVFLCLVDLHAFGRLWNFPVAFFSDFGAAFYY